MALQYFHRNVYADLKICVKNMAFLVMAPWRQALSFDENGKSKQKAYPVYTGLFGLVM